MAAATAGRAFDPNRTYPLVLSERLKNEQLSTSNNPDNYELSTVHIDPELKLPGKVTSAQIKPSVYSDEERSLHIKGAKEGEDYRYSGLEQEAQSLALVFDPTNQTMVLDRIDKDYTFTNEQMAEGSQSGSEDGILNAMIAEEGEADPDNPFDWRHHLRQMESSSPELEPFDPSGLDALASPSPEARPVRTARQASTPPEQFSAQSSSHASPEAEQSEPEFELEIEQDSKPRYQPPPQQEEEEDADSEEGSEDGGFEIIMDGSSNPKFGQRGRRFLGNLEGDGPISLRSAATSRSPAIQADEQSDQSDEDVEPIHLDVPDRKQSPVAQQVDEDADMDEGFDDLEADLEKEFDQDDGDDDGEADEAGGVPIGRYVEPSESESEEE